MALVESRTLRQQYAGRVDVLDRVKALALLPDGVHATTEIVAGYFEVPVKTIESVVGDNREELEANGHRVLRGEELRDFATSFGEVANPVGPKTRSLALFTRRTILNVGQLLRDSDVARRVRQYLLDVEQSTAPGVRAAVAAAGPVSYREQAEILAILRPVLPENVAVAKGRIILARSMGELPEIDPAEVPLYATSFLAEKGLSRKTISNFESGFGLRASNRYLKVHGRRPEKIDGPVGSKIEKIRVYTQADRPILEAVYAEMADLFAAFESGVAA